MKIKHKPRPAPICPKAICLYALSLNISTSDGHPNKMPFAGVLTRLVGTSSSPPAPPALGTLLGMAVDFTPSFDGHDSQAKIGIITFANIVGGVIQIEGFVYAADFPEEAARIQAEKEELGFSFEAQKLVVADPGADPLEIIELAFTGAAILRKDRPGHGLQAGGDYAAP